MAQAGVACVCMCVCVHGPNPNLLMTNINLFLWGRRSIPFLASVCMTAGGFFISYLCHFPFLILCTYVHISDVDQAFFVIWEGGDELLEEAGTFSGQALLLSYPYPRGGGGPVKEAGTHSPSCPQYLPNIKPTAWLPAELLLDACAAAAAASRCCLGVGGAGFLTRRAANLEPCAALLSRLPCAGDFRCSRMAFGWSSTLIPHLQSTLMMSCQNKKTEKF